MKVVQTLIQEKTGLKVGQPDSNGGKTSAGNIIARNVFPIIQVSQKEC